DGDLVEHHRVGLRGQIGLENRETGGVTGPLARQRVGERLAGRTILGADDQVNVRDLVALAYEGFADCKRTDGHDRLLAGESGNLSAGVRQGVKPARIPD